MPRKTEPRLPSPLGMSIQTAVEGHGRYEAHHPAKHYHCTYRTRSAGTVFAVERVNLDGIVMWLPPTERVKRAVATEGVVAEVSLPYPYPDEPDRYGRLSGLQWIHDLAMEPLLRVKVASASQALRILDAVA